MWSSKNRSKKYSRKNSYDGSFFVINFIHIHTDEMGSVAGMPLTDGINKLYRDGWFGEPEYPSVWEAVAHGDFKVDTSLNYLDDKDELIQDEVRVYWKMKYICHRLVKQGSFTEEHRNILGEQLRLIGSMKNLSL